MKRAIKEQEIDRLKITRYSKKDLDKQVVATAKNLGFNKEGLKVFLSAQNLSYEDLIKKYEIEIVDGEDFKAKKYFDITVNNWELKDVGDAFQKIKNDCLEISETENKITT